MRPNLGDFSNFKDIAKSSPISSVLLCDFRAPCELCHGRNGIARNIGHLSLFKDSSD